MLKNIIFSRKACVLLVLSIVLSAGCKSRTPLIEDSDFISVTDDLGRIVSLPRKIERAVSLAPNLTENIFAVGAGERLVGVTSYCDYPEEAKLIRKVGDTQSPNIENIIALKPQVVFVSTASQLESFTATLESQGVAVYVTNPKHFDGVFANLRRLGEIFGTETVAEKVIDGLQRRVDTVKEQVRQKSSVRLFVQVSNDPLFTIGKDSFLTDIVELAGGVSVTRDVDSAYPRLSKESALAMNPDVIILPDSDDNREPNDVFVNSPAVKSGRVYRINAAIISRPGPRLVDAMEEISQYLHQNTN